MKLGTRYLWGATFFSNERIAELPALCRLFLQGLWCAADREGRLEDRPLRLKTLILPYDNFDAEKGLSLLESKKLIQRYEVDGVRLIQICAWEENGRPFKYEKESTLPALSESLLASRLARPLASTLASPLANISTSGSGSDSVVVYNSSSEFEQFWKKYPKKVGKHAASKAWNKQKPPLSAILTALEWQTQQVDWTKDGGQFIPNPSTYLNQGRWKDEPSQISPAKSKALEANQYAEDLYQTTLDLVSARRGA